jgi:hypothetical protein
MRSPRVKRKPHSSPLFSVSFLCDEGVTDEPHMSTIRLAPSRYRSNQWRDRRRGPRSMRRVGGTLLLELSRNADRYKLHCHIKLNHTFIWGVHFLPVLMNCSGARSKSLLHSCLQK